MEYKDTLLKWLINKRSAHGPRNKSLRRVTFSGWPLKWRHSLRLRKCVPKGRLFFPRVIFKNPQLDRLPNKSLWTGFYNTRKQILLWTSSSHSASLFLASSFFDYSFTEAQSLCFIKNSGIRRKNTCRILPPEASSTNFRNVPVHVAGHCVLELANSGPRSTASVAPKKICRLHIL